MTAVLSLAFCALCCYCVYQVQRISQRNATPICERRKVAFGGMPKAYAVTAPRETRKQWRRLQITKKAG